MLRLALGFLVVAIIAALLGFGVIAVVSVEIARTLFIIFLLLFLFALAYGLFNKHGKWPRH